MSSPHPSIGLSATSGPLRAVQAPARAGRHGTHRYTITAGLHGGLRHMPTPRPPAEWRRPAMSDNISKLPSAAAVQRVLLPGAGHSIDNVDGKRASVAIYSYLAQRYGGRLTKDAAAEGVALYDEVVEDARRRPGAHPNIDLLLRVMEQDLALDIVVE